MIILPLRHLAMNRLLNRAAIAAVKIDSGKQVVPTPLKKNILKGGGAVPLYEFYCSKCEKKFEELCGSDTRTAPCPQCMKEAGKVLSLFRAGKSSSGSGAAASSGCGG